MKIEGIRNTNKRHYVYAEIPKGEEIPDGNGNLLGKEKRGFLGQIIDVHKPLIPKDGGIVVGNFNIITPKNIAFYSFSYNKDLEGWRQQIEKGAEILGIRLAKIIDEKYFQINNGEVYNLRDCEFAHYNFYDKNRNLIKELTPIDKKDLFD